LSLDAVIAAAKCLSENDQKALVLSLIA